MIVQLTHLSLLESKIEGLILLNGLLKAGATASYQVHQPFLEGVFTTREQVEKAYVADRWKQEYHSIYVSAELKVLRLRVIFPASHHTLNPPPEAVVFRGRADEEPLTRESEEIADLFHYENGQAWIDVPHPTVGLRYAISWMPPSAAKKKGGAASSAQPANPALPTA